VPPTPASTAAAAAATGMLGAFSEGGAGGGNEPHDWLIVLHGLGINEMLSACAASISD
jgi:hypothetical protein